MSLALRTMICTDAMMREASRPHNVAVEVVVPTCRPAYDGRHMHIRGQWLRGPPICGQDCSLNLASCASRHSKHLLPSITGGENVGLLKNSVFRLETAKERLDLTSYTSCTIADGHGSQ